MIYKSFDKDIQGNVKIFQTTTPLVSVVSINVINFDTQPALPYKVEAEFNNGGFVEIDTNILYNLTSLMEESVDVGLRFTFDVTDNVEEVGVDFTSAYEFMLGVVDNSILSNIMNQATDNSTEDIEDTPIDTPSMASVDLYASPNNVSFWKGIKNAYTATINKSPNIIYFVTDTQELYLGDILVATYNNVAWGTVNSTESVGINIKGDTKTVSLSGHTHANYVPTTRKVNNKALSSDITLSASDVGALASNGTADASKSMVSNLNSITVAPTANSFAYGIIASTNAGQDGFAGTGGFPVSNNANALLTFNTSGNNYHEQLGLSSNGNMYRRSISNKALDTSSPWKTMWDSGNFDPASKANVGQTFYIGTTQIAINRASGEQTLGVSISGNAATATNATNSAQLGGVAAANYWNKTNSNIATVDWTTKNLNVNGLATIVLGTSSATELSYALRIKGGGTANNANTSIGFNVENNNSVGPKGALSFVRTSSYDCGKFVFYLSTNTADGVGTTINDAKFTIENSGKVTASGEIYSGVNKVYHAGNANTTSIAWNASSLTLKGAITGATTGAFSGSVTIGDNLTVTNKVSASELKSTGDVIASGTLKGVDVLIKEKVNMTYNESKNALQFIFK